MLEKYIDKKIAFTSYHENLKEQQKIMDEAKNKIKELRKEFIKDLKKGKLDGWWIKFRENKSEYLYYAKVKKSHITNDCYLECLDIESDKYILVFNDELNIKIGNYKFEHINSDEIEIINPKDIYSIIENCSREILKE